ncbi:dihydropteroate synthase [Natranaerofaba carboxydovora]|uniref:dihydropteroate synthase n=1 Tax=Natranaerofaba carboxydovora TaxID=2742683 RepID=UPI001F12C671|nr:dihydropteroate synthase [Natranaerofaba carboxydovora]UMZ74761.1 5-methyltetrahydrofolate:corrinoid/iron-sulfur protein co-methyltransferase [Natranaerofaba carboxydovora]
MVKMLKTKISSEKKEIEISFENQTALIGERINPTGKKKLSKALQDKDLSIVEKEAKEQTEAGADILDVNVGAAGVDEMAMLPEAVKLVQETVDLPICIDSSSPDAIAKALEVYKGKALINSVTGEEKSMDIMFPLVKEHNAAIIALPHDEEGIPAKADKRLKVVDKIFDRATKEGIPHEDIIIDCLALAVSTDDTAGLAALETIEETRKRYGANITVGASNIAFGMPENHLITGAFLSTAIYAGLTCPIVDAKKVRQYVLATDLVLGRDKFGMRFIKDYRSRS